jgi:hypothetical protein
MVAISKEKLKKFIQDRVRSKVLPAQADPLNKKRTVSATYTKDMPGGSEDPYTGISTGGMSPREMDDYIKKSTGEVDHQQMDKIDRAEQDKINAYVDSKFNRQPQSAKDGNTLLTKKKKK